MRKKLTVITALSAGLLAGAQAQEVVAGWDFSQFVPAFSSTDGQTLVSQANANFVRRGPGQLIGIAGVERAPDFGVIYYDGSFGSTEFSELGTDALYNGGADAGAFNSPGGSLGASGQINTLVAQGQAQGRAQAMSIGSGRNGQSIVIAMDMSDYFDGVTAGSDWFLTYAGQTLDTDGSSSIAWEYSLDGSEYTSVTTNQLSSSLTGYTVDLSDAGETSQLYIRATFNGIDGQAAYFDNLHVNASPVTSGETGGSLFILDNAASVELIQDWYDTPMGRIFVGSEPWIWSIEYGWHFSQPENTPTTAYVYIQDAPFATWVFVDQTSATSQGFWGFAFDAANPALNGWFWFFNEASTNNNGSFFIWDGQQTLTFDDKSNPSSGTASEL